MTSTSALAEERRALSEAGLRVFMIGGKRDSVTWDWLARVVRSWPRIEEVLDDRPPGPWFYLINETGLSEVRLDDDEPPEPHREQLPRTPAAKVVDPAQGARCLRGDRGA